MITKANKFQWVFDSRTDALMFFLPTALAFLFLLFFQSLGIDLHSDRTLFVQLLLYLAFDYAHTYAILFRTYLDPQARQIYRGLLIWTPIGVFALGMALFWISLKTFWTFFGYLQVFHFIRQQYGWMKLAERSAPQTKLDRFLNTAIIYACTGYPVIYWHTYMLREFYWYKNMAAPPPIPVPFERVALAAFIAINIAFCLRMLWVFVSTRKVPMGRILVYSQTFVVWYIGIVQLELSIVSFAALNTIGHGLPYIIFIYRYMKRNWSGTTRWRRAFVGPAGFLPFYLSLLAFALFETYFQFTYSERNYAMAFFGNFKVLPESILAWLIPLLMVPQATHSVLDGFIWKFSGRRESGLVNKVL